MSASLTVNQKLRPNESLLSENGRCKLILESNGNLILYKRSNRLWATNTSGRQVDYALMQADGNFVLYDSSNSALWSTGTFQPGARLVLQNDGKVVIYDPSNRAIWKTG